MLHVHLDKTLQLITNSIIGQMSEEIENAAINVPRAIVTTVILNGSTGWAMVLAVLFCLGDIDSVIVYPTPLFLSPVDVILISATAFSNWLSIHTSILQRDRQSRGYNHDGSRYLCNLVCRHRFRCYGKPDDLVICKRPRPTIPPLDPKGLSACFSFFFFFFSSFLPTAHGNLADIQQS